MAGSAADEHEQMAAPAVTAIDTFYVDLGEVIDRAELEQLLLTVPATPWERRRAERHARRLFRMLHHPPRVARADTRVRPHARSRRRRGACSARAPDDSSRPRSRPAAAAELA